MYGIPEESLQIAIQIVDKLHLNSLRVCNVAKLYAIQALLSVLQGNVFDCERYLLSCAQFLNYILEKQKDDVVHDFARSDDDICLYHFAKAMLALQAEDLETASVEFEETEHYFEKAEGNLFYIHTLYRKSRMELFQKLGRMEMYEVERTNLLQHHELIRQIALQKENKRNKK